MTPSGPADSPLVTAALVMLYTSVERLVDAVESLLDDDAREGSELTEEAWLEARDSILARVRDSKDVLDDPAILSALSH